MIKYEKKSVVEKKCNKNKTMPCGGSSSSNFFLFRSNLICIRMSSYTYMVNDKVSLSLLIMMVKNSVLSLTLSFRVILPVLCIHSKYVIHSKFRIIGKNE